MNQTTLFIWRLGIDPILKYTRDRIPVCHLSLAEHIQGHSKPHWHKVIVWGKQAEYCNVFLKKGAEVFVQGRKVLKDSINGNTQNKYEEISADRVGFLTF